MVNSKMFVAMALVIFSMATHAASVDVAGDEEQICKMSGRSMDDVNCSRKRFEAVETELNSRYQVFMKRLDEAMKREPHRLQRLKKNFIVAQRAWVRFREKECAAVETWFTHGSLQKAYYYDCMKAMARRRISAFELLGEQRK